MTIRTQEFRIDKNFNVETLNSFLEKVEKSGGRIVNQFAVQLDNGRAANYYVTFEDVVPPEVIRTFPADGQVGVPVDSDIVIIFSEDVLLGTNPFEILKNGSNVPGFTWVESGGRVDISSAITGDIGSYTVRVKRSDVTDVSGNAMTVDFTFSFTSALDPLSGAFIVDRINTSNSVINDANTAPEKSASEHIHANYGRSVKSRGSVVGATGIYSDDFFTDASADPGAPYVPPTTTAHIDTAESDLLNDFAGNGGTGVFYSSLISATGTTDLFLEFDAKIPTGGSVLHEIIKDGETSGFTTLAPDVFTTVPALAVGFRVRTQMINPGTGGFPTVHNQEIYFS